ncbi:MAG: MFS transporter [Clostridia bacterium]|nr:MFS transporter [Clostridia bacterium]
MSENTDIYSNKDYKVSRRAYSLECMFEHFITLLVTDAFIAKLLKYFGTSDALCGIISSFISLSFLFQIFSVLIMGRIRHTKRTAIIFHTAAQFLFSCLYLIPFLPVGNGSRRVVFIVCILTAYFGNYFVTNLIYKWGNSFVDPHKRASFSSVKEMVSLFAGMIVSLGLGYAIDKLDESGDLSRGFLLSSVCMLLFCAGDFVCLLCIKKDSGEEEKKEMPKLSEIMKNTLGNKNYVHTVVLKCLWWGAVYTTVGFLGTYKQEELFYTLGQIQLINIIGYAGRFALSRLFGRFSDRHGFVRGIQLALIVAAAGFAANIFTAPGTRWLIIVFVLLYNISMAGTYQNMINISYAFVDVKYFVQAAALKDCIAGVFGFFCALASGRLMSAIQARGNTLFGVTVYAQQVQSVLSLLFVIAALIYAQLALSHKKTMLQ